MSKSLRDETGCHKHDDCLTCPEDKCIYENEGFSGAKERHAKIREMAKYMKRAAIAKELGISKGIVYYALRGASNG